MRIRSLSLLILMVLGAYVLCEEVGIAKIVNDKFEPATTTSKVNTQINIEKTYYVSMLRDPTLKGFRILRGAIKKRALDGMVLIGQSKIVFSAGATDEMVENTIQRVALQFDSNIAIIDVVFTKVNGGNE